jgi:stage V sporulation protein AD
MKIGNSIRFKTPVCIKETYSLAGPKEGEGALKDFFDEIADDMFFNEDTWERAETRLITQSVSGLLRKAGLAEKQIDYIIAGDLLNQSTSTTFGVKDFGIPHLGVYSACASMGEALGIAAVLTQSGASKKTVVSAASHFCSAEKQFRSPLELGVQRPPGASWTVTGDGCVLVTDDDEPPYITGITTGIIVDLGIKDQNNMGASMAPAAAHTIARHMADFNLTPDYYDLIITGDLGKYGNKILLTLLQNKGFEIDENKLSDCGVLIFDESQDAHAGGSGCACSAVTLAGYLYSGLKKGIYNKILFVPTGALLSPLTVMQKETVPGIAHAVAIENTKFTPAD